MPYYDHATTAAMASAALMAFPRPLACYDTDRYLFVNAAFLAAAGGAAASSVLDTDPYAMVDADSREASITRSKAVMQGATLRDVVVKASLPGRDSETISCTICPVSADGRTAILATVDLTPQVDHTDTEARFSEDAPDGLALAMLNALPCAVIIHDHETILHANREALEAFGASITEQVIGRSLGEFVHPDGRDAGAQRRELVIGEGCVLHGIDAKMRRIDGTTFQALVSGLPIEFAGHRAVLVCTHEIR